MQAEIITIGTELLLGEIVDTNSAWIAQRLTTIGLNLYYTVTVGDNLDRCAQVLAQALERSDVVITTGGLGPTVDDVTREAVAAAAGRTLYRDEALVEEIATYFGRRGYTMTENNKKQADLPVGADVIHNPVGTAPSFRVEQNGHVIISLPGVPHEMKYLMENEVIPFLKERFGLSGVIKSRTLRTCGIGESTIDTLIGDLMHSSNPTVGTAAHPGQTDVRITVKADSTDEAEALLGPMEQALRERLGLHVFGVDEESLADVVTRLLAERGQRLYIVETTTRGELARRVSSAERGADAFAGGQIVPDADVMVRQLGVPEAVIAKHGMPSQAVADAAAEAGQRMGADYALALIGPADPAAPDSPPVYFSLATPDELQQGESRQGRAGPAGMGWLMHLGLDMVRRDILSSD